MDKKLNLKQLKRKLKKIEKSQSILSKEKEKIEQGIINLTEERKNKRLNIFKHKKGEEGNLLDYEEMIITGKEIGTTSNNMEFRIDKFKDGTFGFFINTNTQGNFILNKKEMVKLREFLK